MLAYVCKEQEEVFSANVRLFPMNFPAKQDSALDDIVDDELIKLHF